MPAITLPDKSVRRFDGPVTGTTVAEAIGPGLARAALAMKLDGKLVDLATEIDHDADVVFVTRRDPEALELIRHDAAHVLAEAVQELYPGHPGHHRPGDRRRLLLRFRPQRAVHPGGLRADRGEDARDRRARRKIRPPGDGPRRGDPVLPGQGRKIQGGDHPGPAARRDDLAVSPGRLGRPVPRPAYALHRRCRRRVQADEGRRRLLAGRSPQRHAVAHLRHRLARPEGARRLPAHAGGGGTPRPPPHRQGDGPVPSAGGSRRQRVLASQGLEALPHRRGLYAPAAGCGRLPGGEDPAVAGPRALGALRPLGELPAEHVHRQRRGRGQDAGGEADELPVPCADLPPGHPLLPRAAAASRRVRLLPPLRAVGRAARHHAGAGVHAGRRAHLLHRGSRSPTRARGSSSCWPRSTATSAFRSSA